jgi:hypothetical protein
MTMPDGSRVDTGTQVTFEERDDRALILDGLRHAAAAKVTDRS